MIGTNKLIATVLGAIFTAIAVSFLSSAPTNAVSSSRNCNDDAIIRCGAVSESELLQKYDKNVGDVQSIYRRYGITRDMIAGTASGIEIKHGTVHRDGRVVVDGKVVARDAYSLSRIAYKDDQGRSPETVRINGTTLYAGPNMNIFVRSVDVYAFMRNGQFYKGVLSSCANPLMATPTEKPKPQPKPEKPVIPKPEKPVTPKPQPKPEKCPIPGKEHLPKDSPDCKKDKEMCPIPGKEHLPKDSPDCKKEKEKCPISGKEHLPKDSVDCKETVIELPQTGIGTFIGGTLGAGSVSAAGYYWAMSRRKLSDVLKNR